MGGRDLRGRGGEGAKQRVNGVLPGRPQSFRYQRRPVDDCSPGQGGKEPRRRNKGRNLSWRNGAPLQRKPGLDYGIQ